jgi:DNA-directed RNA polymerase beta' subunit
VGEIEIGRMTPDQIERWRRIYQAEVANEKRADRRRRGLPDRRMIGMRFSSP